MYCVSRVAAVAIAAVCSFARDAALADSALTARDAPRFLLFANTDLWRHGGFAHGGLVFAPAGLDREGLVFKLMFGGGTYRYISGALGNIEVAGRQFATSAMPGWRFMGTNLIVTAFAGLDYQDHRLTPDDPSAGLRGSAIGLRVAVEVWWEPTPHMMVAADASVSTVGPSYSARVAAGWRLFERYYLGPELQAFTADDNYHQARIGIHVTAMKFGRFEWSGGFGWAIDSDERDSVYGKLGLISRY
jgi:hypothetical protein